MDVGKSPSRVAIPNFTSVWVTNTGDSTVSIIELSDNKLIGTVDVGIAPIGITSGPFGQNIYVANSGSNTMSSLIVALGALQGVVGTFDVGEGPVGIASSTSSAVIPVNVEYVANQGSNTITIRDFDQQFALDVADAPTGIAVTPEGDTIFVTHLNSNMVGQIDFIGNSVNNGYSEEFLCPTGDRPVAVAIAPDTDADGVSNNSDTDSDNDGITDDDETSGDSAAAQSAIALRNVDPNDPDGDRLINLRDLDSDGDCIPDHFEAGGGNDSDKDGLSDNFVDIDMDGLHDEHDPDQTGNNLPLPDTDNDGTPDFLDRDSDNDGRTDAEEAGGLDEDGDGIHDELEDLNRDGLADACHPDTGTPLPILDLNSNGVPDFLEAESNDGSSSCSLAAPGAAPSFPLYLLIPAFILINRFWRRRTN